MSRATLSIAIDQFHVSVDLDDPKSNTKAQVEISDPGSAVSAWLSVGELVALGRLFLVAAGESDHVGKKGASDEEDFAAFAHALTQWAQQPLDVLARKKDVMRRELLAIASDLERRAG